MKPDPQIRNDLLRAYSLVVEHKRRADSLGKNLVLVIGERHTSRFALGIELMVEFAFHDLGISRAGCEFDRQKVLEGERAQKQFLLSHFPEFDISDRGQRKKIIKRLPPIMKPYETSNENPTFLNFFQFLNGTTMLPFDPLWKTAEGKVMSDAGVLIQESMMVRTLATLANEGSLYAVAGLAHSPILVESLRQNESLLVPLIVCANTNNLNGKINPQRVEKIRSLATWIPSIFQRPETFTASQMMEFALDALPDARKKHNLFPGSTNSKSGPRPAPG